jgi:phosphatidylserine/phosphatidylglycerophosphate/cardiolipin synthase-like enzyme
MRSIRFAIPAALLFLLSAHPAFAQDIEIIESTPTGTMLDNPGIRDAKDVWLEMINSAHRTLDFEEFYVSTEPGSALEKVLDAIAAAADRGVHVRLIVDARMYKTYPMSVDSLGGHRNCEVRIIDFGKIAGGVQHAKYFIADGREVFVGSQNFDWRSLEQIHELGLRIRSDPFAEAYASVFEADWRMASGEDVSLDGSAKIPPIRIAVHPGDTAVVSPTFSPKGWIPDSILWDERVTVGLLDGAQHTVVLQFLAYSTTVRKGDAYTVIDDAIRRAAGRGVKVRMLVADWEKGTSSEASLKSLSMVPNIEVAYSCIPEAARGYIPFARVEHCKYIVVDASRFWLGTANCERGYYYGTRNLGLVCASTTLARQLEGIFEKSWGSPYRERVAADVKYIPRVHGEQAP